ncbi:MAG TPA: DUF2851 family protein, partial [Candidatus Eisenbacteria bacterium]|nr:DUF2851 family protein [Candidatus Eisenbacteria bacterium]
MPLKLDFDVGRAEKQWAVTLDQTNFYAEWRARQHSRLVGTFKETPETPPPERLLQTIWHHQRLRRDQLRLSDGRQVRVLHPGFWNREAGPDFRDAVLQIDTETPHTGDVEVDIHSSGWRGHGHDRNPNFKNVALHVVWEGDGCTETPTLPLKTFLDAPLPELAQWLGSEAAQVFPEELTGQCCAPLRNVPAEQLTELLHQAALVRLRRKASDLAARARQAGWDQALWEGLLRALGYKHNAWPLQCLAELRPRLLGGEQVSVLQLQARLLGVGGLLPAELTRTRSGTDQYLRRVWDFWWREREAFQDCALPRELWHFSGLRPANHPQRRLALVAHWWNRKNLIDRLQKWFAAGKPIDHAPAALLDCLQAADDPFWSRHWTLRSAALAKPQPLLGATR